MSHSITYPFTAVPNDRLTYYAQTATSRPPIQTAILLYLERAITGWHKKALVIAVSELARCIKATRSATSKALKALTQAGEVCRGDLTDKGYPLWLPEGLGASEVLPEANPVEGGCVREDTRGCVREDTGKEVETPKSSARNQTPKEKKKQKTKTIPPKPPTGGDEDVPDKHTLSTEALAQLESLYPVTCIDRELATRRLTHWLSVLSLKELLVTVKHYVASASYHLALECFLAPSCLPKWLATQENYALAHPELPDTQPPPEQTNPKSKRRRRRRSQNAYPQPPAEPVKTKPPVQPAQPDPESVAWNVIAQSGNDVGQAIITLSEYTLKGHTTFHHATAALTTRLRSVWKDAPESDEELALIVKTTLEDALAQLTATESPNPHVHQETK